MPLKTLFSEGLQSLHQAVEGSVAHKILGISGADREDRKGDGLTSPAPNIQWLSNQEANEEHSSDRVCIEPTG